MNIVFMGTPDFAVPCLRALLEDGHRVSLVVTQADKPKGRGHRLTAPPVKELALTSGIPVFQPTTLKNGEAAERIAAARPELIVVVAYGKILPPAILSLPPEGCINVHGSLLPRYRGAAPIQWAVLNGETETGVTTMRMDAGLDTGDMLLSSRLAIPPDMTAGELYDALADEGAVLLSRTLREMVARTLRAVPQPRGRGDLCSHARSKPVPDGLEEAGLRAAQSGAGPESLAVRHYGGGGAPHEGAPQPGRGWCRSGAGPDCEVESLYGILRGEHLLGAARNPGRGIETHACARLFPRHPVKLGDSLDSGSDD